MPLTPPSRPSDTERPAAASGTEFGAEPPSGVAPTAAQTPGESTRVAPLPDPRRPAAPRPPGSPSSNRMPAAPPVPPRHPSSNRLPAVAPRANTQPNMSAPSSSQRVVAAKPLVARPSTPDIAFAPPPVPMPAAGAVSNTVPAPPPSAADAAAAGVAPPHMLQRPPTPQGTSLGLAPPADVIAAIEAGAPIEGAPPSQPQHAAVALTRRCTTCDERYPGDFLVCPRDATPLADETGEHLVDPLLGKLLGETYQIVRVVGEGGMGRVYEARHLRLKQRRYAVKTLHAELARNVEMAARFMREAEAVSGLAHPNVVDVFDVHHLPDGTPYLVGEFLEGEELADYVTKRGALEAKIAANVAIQVCRALGAAHANGVVHRDMKPENIFVLKSSIEALDHGETKYLAVKVLDFGISKTGGKERTHLTKTGVIMGTPSYMAPEQARGKQVDHRADVYSVGACLYYMITGKRPFDSDDPTSTISMVLMEDPQRPREIDPRIPESLELIVQRAMSKDVRERHQTMAELERALDAFLQAGRALSSRPQQVLVADMSLKETGAKRAFDLARAALGSHHSLAPPPPTASSEAKLARPTIAVASAALAFWFIGGTAAALGGLVRVLHDGEITVTESVLLLVGCLFASATPIGLYVAHVKKKIWPNSVRAVQLASDLRRVTAAAFVSYGALTLLNRVAHTIFLRSSHRLASGIWDMALFALSVVLALTIGGFAPLVRNMRKRRSESS